MTDCVGATCQLPMECVDRCHSQPTRRPGRPARLSHSAPLLFSSTGPFTNFLLHFEYIYCGDIPHTTHAYIISRNEPIIREMGTYQLLKNNGLVLSLWKQLLGIVSRLEKYESLKCGQKNSIKTVEQFSMEKALFVYLCSCGKKEGV